MARRLQWFGLILLIVVATVISYAVAGTFSDPVGRALFHLLFLFLLIVCVVVAFSMIVFVARGNRFSTYHPVWALRGLTSGDYPIWMYTKHYKEYYDHVGNLDHGREAYEEERRREYSRPEGLIDISRGRPCSTKGGC